MQFFEFLFWKSVMISVIKTFLISLIIDQSSIFQVVEAMSKKPRPPPSMGHVSIDSDGETEDGRSTVRGDLEEIVEEEGDGDKQ